jgi:hypothetical protein
VPVREDGATLDQGSGAVVRTVHQARRLARRAGGGKRGGGRRAIVAGLGQHGQDGHLNGNDPA